MDFPVVKDLRRGGGGNRRRGRGRRGGRGGQHSASGRVAAAAESNSEAAEGEHRTTGDSEDEDPWKEEEATFSRRQVRSNWDRYDEDSAAAMESVVSAARSTGGDDYHDVLQRAGTAASQPKLDDDSIPASAAAAATALTYADPAGASLPTSLPQSVAEVAGRLKRIDMTAVLDSIHRLPVGVRLLLGSEAEEYLHSRAYIGDSSGSDSFKHYWRTKAPVAAQPSSSSADATPKVRACLMRPTVGVAVVTAPLSSHPNQRADQPPAAAAVQKHLGSRSKRGQPSAASPDAAAAVVTGSKPQQSSLRLPVHLASRSIDGVDKSSSPSAMRAAELTTVLGSSTDSPQQPVPFTSSLASVSLAGMRVAAPSCFSAASLPLPSGSTAAPTSTKSLEDELDELLAL